MRQPSSTVAIRRSLLIDMDRFKLLNGLSYFNQVNRAVQAVTQGRLPLPLYSDFKHHLPDHHDDPPINVLSIAKADRDTIRDWPLPRGRAEHGGVTMDMRLHWLMTSYHRLEGGLIARL